MMVNCQFCCLQDRTKATSNSLIVDALQQVIKSLLTKDSDDIVKFRAQTEKLEVLQKAVKEMQMKVKAHQDENHLLKANVNEEKRRSDQYKHKLQKAQEALIQLHKFNQAISKNTTESLLFSRSSGEKDKESSLVLAPDTCQAESDDANLVNFTNIKNTASISEDHSFTKPLPKRKRLSKTSFRSDRLKKARNERMSQDVKEIETIKEPENDLDETCLPDHADTGTHVSNDEEFCIPASPVLSGYSGSLKQTSFLCGQMKTTVVQNDLGPASPSLLPNAGQSEAVSMKKINFESSESESDSDFSNEEFGKHESITSYQHRTRKSLSPIELLDSNSEDENADKREAYDSLNELFDKTDEAVPNISNLDDTRLEVNVERLDLRALDRNHIHQQNPNKFDYDSDDFQDKPKIRTAKPFSPKNKSLDADEKLSCLSSEDSFNVAPKNDDAPKFKYQSVVRKRAERAKLGATACAQCEKYYSDLPPEEQAQRIRDVCRHRHEYAPPKSPEHFWDIGIPDTLECKRRGYIVDEDDLCEEDVKRLRGRRRRRPYDATKQ
uniref:DNA endonuclease activator Ctp1 C-terminal domain-containing protein n=1 Tax=Ciona savignyi TaxID=51511 RepID=H2YBX1_CIOSA